MKSLAKAFSSISVTNLCPLSIRCIAFLSRSIPRSCILFASACCELGFGSNLRTAIISVYGDCDCAKGYISSMTSEIQDLIVVLAVLTNNSRGYELADYLLADMCHWNKNIKHITFSELKSEIENNISDPERNYIDVFCGCVSLGCVEGLKSYAAVKYFQMLIGVCRVFEEVSSSDNNKLLNGIYNFLYWHHGHMERCIGSSALNECYSYLKEIKTKIYDNEARISATNYTPAYFNTQPHNTYVNKQQRRTSDSMIRILKNILKTEKQIVYRYSSRLSQE